MLQSVWEQQLIYMHMELPLVVILEMVLLLVMD